ncbi:MAG: hypothetical protein WDN66_04740 [Candidatus Saccharibacteria bacterium]
MAKLSQRFFAIFFALLFLVTSSFVAIAFILSNVENKDNSKGSQTASTPPPQSQTSTPASSGQKLTGFTPVSNVLRLGQLI